MKLAGLETMNMTGIRYWDNMNPWVDFVVYVPGRDEQAVNRIAKKVRRAMDAYWECEYDTYGEALEDALKNTVAFIVYHTRDWDEEDDDYENAWEQMLSETEIAVTLQD